MNYVNMSSPDVIRVPEGYRSDIARNIDVILGMVYDSINDYIWISARNGLYVYDLGSSSFSESPVKVSACLGACIVSGKLWVSSLEGLNVIDLETLQSRVLDGFPVCMSLVPDGEDKVEKKFNVDKLKETDPDTYNKYLEDTIVNGRSGYVKITAPKTKEG